MDSAEFDRLVTYEKKRQKSLEQGYNMLDPERAKGSTCATVSTSPKPIATHGTA